MTTQTNPDLLGWRLGLSRIAWVSIAVLFITVFVAGVPVRFAELAHPCQPGTCYDFLMLGPEEHSLLHGWGIASTTYALYEVGLEILLATMLTILGIFIFWRKSDSWIGVVVSLVLISFGTSFLSEGDMALTRAYVFWKIPFALTESITSVALGFLLYSFPDGRLVPRWSSIVVSIFALGYPVLLVVATLNGIVTNDNPELLYVPEVLYLILGFICQIYRYRFISSRVEQQQTKWIQVGFAVIILGAVGWYLGLSYLNGGAAQVFFAVFGLGITAILLTTFPISLAISIMRYRLWDIDVLIRRTLVYAIITGVLGLFYFGMVAVIQSLFVGVTGQSSSLAIVASTLAIAALFNPLRRRVQNIVDRRFFRQKYDAQHTIEEFAASLRDEVELEHLESELVRVVEATMQPESISLWVADQARKPIITERDFTS